jgi:hypothetical protein
MNDKAQEKKRDEKFEKYDLDPAGDAPLYFQLGV